ncbi:MAG: glycosyltransferase family 4 protein, partial [Pseudomonadota bacterium]
IHHLRMLRQFELNGDKELFEKAIETKGLELDVIRGADATIVVSEFEVSYLNEEIGPFASLVIPLIYEPFERTIGFEQRADIAFVGGYRHPPNIDAVKWLVEDIWPLMRQYNIGAKLHIIGSHMPADFQDYSDTDIEVVGFVEDLESYLSRIKLTVAPLRYGAGVKGKVGNSLRMGVPVVGTSIATEGMGLKSGEHVLAANTADQLARSMAQVYTDAELWQSLSTSGQARVLEQFGMDAAKSKLDFLVRSLIK